MKILFLFIIIFSWTDKSFSQWISINSGTVQNLHSVSFINHQTGFTCGDNGLILKTTGGGVNWFSLISGTSENIYSVCFYNSNTGIACGNSGLIIMTTNSGAEWVNVPSGVTDDLLAVSFNNNSNGVCAGRSGSLLYSSNGGLNWTVSKNGFLTVFYGISMVTGSVAYACGVNTIFQPFIAKTLNGGSNWSYSNFYLNGNEGNLRDIYFITANEGFVVSNVFDGRGGISYTGNGGDNWATQLFSERLNCIEFSGMNTGYAAGYNGMILKTNDNGVTWNIQQSGVSGILRSIDFADAATGYICGDAGVILKTTNGGLTGVNSENAFSEQEFFLSQNYPNPFNPLTEIKYKIYSGGRVLLKVYDITGKLINVLVNQNQTAGSYSVAFNSGDLPGGIYFYRIDISRQNFFKRMTETKKMILIK